MDHWNELVAIMNDPKAKEKYTDHNGKDVSYAEFARILLNGLNTASGARTKSSIENFVHSWEDFKEGRKTLRIVVNESIVLDGNIKAVSGVLVSELSNENKRKINKVIKQAARDGYTHVTFNDGFNTTYEMADLLQSIEIWESEQSPSN